MKEVINVINVVQLIDHAKEKGNVRGNAEAKATYKIFEIIN